MCGDVINNEFYKDLGEAWHTSQGDAVALLRLENQTKSPWVAAQIAKFHQAKTTPVQILDIGCGGGFLTLALAGNSQYHCTGMDVDETVLSSGRARDPLNRIDWVVGQAEALPFTVGSFDVVCIMDVLEHVRDPKLAVKEALRVLKTDGTFIFHTFNRTWLSWLLAAKGLDWFIKNSQSHVHDWKMFIKPTELEHWINDGGFQVEQWSGIHPRLTSVLKLMFTREVPKDFAFTIGGGLQVGYLGAARKLIQ